VSESTSNSRGRKLLGKPTEEVCRDIAAKWSGRFTEWHQSKDSSGPLRALFEICRDVAENLAGRPVEVVWCSSWSQIRGSEMVAVPGPPDEVWTALDGSPFEGVGGRKSTRDELLRDVFEHRLAKDWDRVHVKRDMESIGFVCEVWNRTEKRDLVTTTTPQFTCTAHVGEIVGAPSKPLFLFGLLINVSVKFAETGEPRGWQQIEVKTGEAHL
jgi:hypothetical protein